MGMIGEEKAKLFGLGSDFAGGIISKANRLPGRRFAT
jgi:hypothetical protein